MPGARSFSELRFWKLKVQEKFYAHVGMELTKEDDYSGASRRHRGDLEIDPGVDPGGPGVNPGNAVDQGVDPGGLRGDLEIDCHLAGFMRCSSDTVIGGWNQALPV